MLKLINKIKDFKDGLRAKPSYMYTPEEYQHFLGYIKRNFGEADKVYIGDKSSDIRVDILIIPPTEKSNYYKLITMGMGAYKMNVPDEGKEYDLERAELIAYLPPDWDLSNKNDKYNWVISELQTLCRIPIIENDWLGFGHTISNEGGLPLTKDADFSSIVLLSGVVETEGYSIDLKFDEKGTINFYQVFPLYKEEYNYIKSKGIEAFPDMLPDPENFIPIIDVNRKNFCKELSANKKQEGLALDDYDIEK